MRRSTALPLLALLFVTPAPARAAPDGLEPMYARIAADLKAGRPLIIAAYYGMWFTHDADPDRNLNWGTYYGNARMMHRARRDAHVRKLYRFPAWQPVFEAEGEVDPLRTLVFHQRVRPNARWRAHGVTAPFDAYLVMQAFQRREGAALRATRTLRQGRDRVLTLPDGVRLDVGAAQVAGYVGHNLFYDYPDFEWDGLEGVDGVPDRPVGAFAIGCKTGRVPGFDALLGPGVHGVLFSKTLMAAEGYSTLALVDAVLGRLTAREAVRLGNDTYRYFQRLGKPDRRVGRPFVADGVGLPAR